MGWGSLGIVNYLPPVCRNAINEVDPLVMGPDRPFHLKHRKNCEYWPVSLFIVSSVFIHAGTTKTKEDSSSQKSLFVPKSKVDEWLSQSVGEWQSHLLSCPQAVSGQLKTDEPFMVPWACVHFLLCFTWPCSGLQDALVSTLKSVIVKSRLPHSTSRTAAVI